MQTTHVVGRASELAAVQRALGEVEAGEWRVLAISGEPGIGKTRLLSELAARAAQHGNTVLSGQGTELEQEVPFAALIEALDEFLGSLGRGRLQALAARLPHLAGVFPALGGLTALPTGLGTERYHHHRAIRALVTELASPRPLVLVLDDVHWADPASVEAIAHLLRRPPAAAILLALSFRTGQASPMLVTALEAAARETHTEQLLIGALTEDECAGLLAHESDAERHRIFAESGGNPFYIEQLRRADATAGTRTGAGAVRLDGAIPATVLAAIEQELSHLPLDARRMLEGAAVAGEPFEPELAAETAGLDPALSLALLDELTARDCVRAEPTPRRFRFRHPIVRRAVYDSIPPGRRLAAHRRAAEALGALGAPVTARAHHIALSARPGDESAIAALSDAARQVAASAPASAAQWLVVTLSLLASEDVSHRLALLSRLAEAQAAAGALPDAARTLVEITAALPAGSDSRWAKAVAASAAVELELGRHGGARTRLQTALEQTGVRGTVQAVPLLLALALDLAYQSGEFLKAVELCHEALEAAVADGDPVLRAAARSVLAAVRPCAGEIRQAADCAVTAAAELDALSDEQLIHGLEVPYRLGQAETFLERFEDGARHLERGVAIATACGNSQFVVPTRTFLAYCLFHLGRIDDTLRVAEEAAETGRLLRLPAGLAFALAVAALGWSVVDSHQTLGLGEEAVSVLADVDDSIITDATHAHFAWACANVGEHKRCIEHMQLAGAPDFERFQPGQRCFLTESLVRSHLAMERRDEARLWVARGVGFASGLGLPVAESAVRRAQAMLLLADGSADAAAELALQAAEIAAEHAAEIEAARSRIIAGRALAAAGRRDHAITQLRLARTDMARCGARRVDQEAARELRLLGAAAPAAVGRRAGDAGTTRLSDRELEIAILVAAGNTNPQIAATLYLSPKTIEGHMHRIFEKLHVTSRAQVAATIAGQEQVLREGPTSGVR